MSRDDWMRALATHMERMRLVYPEDELALVFDIDGTITDTRHLVVHVLIAYDRARRTDLFRGIRIEADVGRRVTLAWHGVNDAYNLREFVASEVRWPRSTCEEIRTAGSRCVTTRSSRRRGRGTRSC